MLVSVLFRALIIFPSTALALCPSSKTQILAQSEVARYVLDVNIYGEDDRKTAADFAETESGVKVATIESRYGASGDFRCGDKSFGQAQVVIKNDVILTSAHNFYEGTACPTGSAPPLSACKFTTRVGGKSTDYFLDRKLASGFKCHDDTPGFDAQDDWIIFKLSKSTDSKIKPYQIPKTPQGIIDHLDLVQVAKSKDFVPKGVKSMTDVPKHFGKCQKKFSDPEHSYFETDCDSDGWSSGGAVLTPGSDPILLGLVKGRFSKPCPEGNSSNKTGPYVQGCWGTVNTSISADLYRELRTLKAPGTEGFSAPSERTQFRGGESFKDL